MNTTNKKQAQLHQMELDEKYLSRKLVEIADNKPVIISNVRKYKQNSRLKNKEKLLVHEKALIKMLKINVRITRLLVEKDYVKPMHIFGFNLYTIAEIERFLKNY